MDETTTINDPTKEVAMTTSKEASQTKRERHIVPLEPVMDCGTRGRWEYCSLRDHMGQPVGQRYMHVNCDALTDREGNCIYCGAPSPSSSRW
jgi:hypothetical protein